MRRKLLLFGVAAFASFVSASCSEKPETESSLMQNGFSWVIENKLAGMPRPGSATSYDDDLSFLSAQGIDLLVSLTELPMDPDSLKEHEIESLHLPVEDFHPPTLEQLHLFVDSAKATIDAGGAVGVHCAAGKGRTGTFLATYLVSTGLSPDEAIAEVRRLRPGSIETAEQEEAIRQYYESLERE